MWSADLESELSQANGLVQTRHLMATQPGTIEAAARLIQQGAIVAFPTDTVYGIGVNVFDGNAVARLYQAKQRALDKGIPILLADPDDMDKVAQDIPAVAMEFAHRFWPGPLTIIVPKRPGLPEAISPNEGIAVRIPDSDVARRLIRSAGGVIATTSANLSGHPPAQTGAEAVAELTGLVAAVLDNGPCPGGVASTIVDCRGSAPLIVREGPISAEALSLTNTEDS